MEITGARPETQRGPAEWFTGDVFLDAIASASPPSRMNALSVHFTPGARTAWHTHPLGQVLYVIEGEGRAQSKGGPVEVIKAGDIIRFEPGEEHWHGAGPKTFMTHIALQESGDDGKPADWGEHVTDEEYLAEPAS